MMKLLNKLSLQFNCNVQSKAQGHLRTIHDDHRQEQDNNNNKKEGLRRNLAHDGYNTGYMAAVQKTVGRKGNLACCIYSNVILWQTKKTDYPHSLQIHLPRFLYDVPPAAPPPHPPTHHHTHTHTSLALFPFLHPPPPPPPIPSPCLPPPAPFQI